MGLESYQNFGVSGYTLKQIATKVQGTTATGDVIFIMGGVNDQNFHKPLGTIDDSTEQDTIYGALKLLCSTLKSKYPTKLVVFITPHYQVRYPSNLGITSYEVSKAIKEVCYLYAFPVYDNFQNSGIYPQNATNKSTYTTDGAHWNDLGHEKVGRNIAKYMLNTFAHLTDVIIKDDEDTGGDDNPGDDDNEDTGGDNNSYTGKKLIITGAKNNYWHLTAVISSDGIKVGDTIGRSLKLSNTTNIKGEGLVIGGVGIFGATSTGVSDGAFSGEVADGRSFSHVVSDGVTNVICENVNIKQVGAPYFKVPFAVGTTGVPCEGVIEELKITVNGVEQEILNLGGFFAEETCTLK